MTAIFPIYRHQQREGDHTGTCNELEAGDANLGKENNQITATMARQQMEFMSEFKPVLAEYDGSGSEDEEDAEFVPVNTSFDKFNESFEKYQEFWKHAYENYEKFANENNAKKQNDFEKFNEYFEQQSDFWKNASISLDQSDFEKLVEEQCLDVPMDVDVEPYINLSSGI